MRIRYAYFKNHIFMKTPIKFNHEAETISESLGITNERFESLKEQSFQFIMSENNPSRVAEKMHEEFSEAEVLLFATMYLSSIIDRMTRI
jgi:hypothetical protein